MLLAGYNQDKFSLGCPLPWIKKKIIIKKKTTVVQLCRLKDIEHKSMKQVSYSGKYSLSASRVHHSHLQFFFVVGHAFSTIIKYLHM